MFEIASKWNREDAIELCKQIEAFAPEYGCHVALTGGLLYKDGPRKDADIMFYRIRQAAAIRVDALFTRLEELGVKRIAYGVHANPDVDPTYTGIWLQKATFRGKKIDFLFPDEPYTEEF